MPAISPLITLFLGIWDPWDYLGRTDLTFDLSQMWPQRVAIVSVLSVWGAGGAQRSWQRKRKQLHSIRKYFSPP